MESHDRSLRPEIDSLHGEFLNAAREFPGFYHVAVLAAEQRFERFLYDVMPHVAKPYATGLSGNHCETSRYTWQNLLLTTSRFMWQSRLCEYGSPHDVVIDERLWVGKCVLDQSCQDAGSIRQAESRLKGLAERAISFIDREIVEDLWPSPERYLSSVSKWLSIVCSNRGFDEEQPDVTSLKSGAGDVIDKSCHGGKPFRLRFLCGNVFDQSAITFRETFESDPPMALRERVPQTKVFQWATPSAWYLIRSLDPETLSRATFKKRLERLRQDPKLKGEAWRHVHEGVEGNSKEEFEYRSDWVDKKTQDARPRKKQR